MSLLIKALEKAEQGKTAGTQTSSVADELSLESMDGLADEDGFAADRLERTENTSQARREAAAMLAAKRSVRGSPNRTVWMAIAGLALLLALGGGLYLYLQSLEQPALVVPRSEPIQPLAPVPDTPSAVPAEVQPTGEQSTSLVTPPQTDANSSAGTENERQDTDKAAVRPNKRVADAASPVTPVAKPAAKPVQTFGDPVAVSEDTTVKISRTPVVAGINPNLSLAYQALLAGDNAAALKSYRQVLQGDALNVDALLGMATVASRQGKLTDAQAWYGKVLEIEPRNAVALAGLAGLSGQADAVGSETRIKNLLAQQPQAAYLHAALGDLYASQSQWPAAQAAYFQAHHYAPDNADYLFNLAVSLDQMAKPGLALDYYRQALTKLDQGRSATFDRTQLESRIVQLQTVAPQ